MTSLHLRVGIASPSSAVAADATQASSKPAKPPATSSCKDAARLARNNPRLLSFDELPAWYQDNPHIRHGCRPVSGSVITSFLSWGYIHNETINIYSHLLPAIAFVLGEWYIYQYLHGHYSQLTIADDFVFAFFLTAAICLGLSSTYHTLINHSQALESLYLRLDFVGIILLTIGNFVSGIHMVFWCEPMQRRIYWAMILSLGLMAVFVMISPKFQGRRWRNFRILCFVGTGMSGLVPLAHGIYLFGFSQMLKQSGMPYYLIEGGFLCLGALVYATRFPECLSPGTFDLYGSSHQVFHVLVVMATATQLVGILAAFDYNYHHRICSLL